MPLSGWSLVGPGTEAMMGSGICYADLMACERGRIGGAVFAIDIVQYQLEAMRDRWPGMDLRDAVGWVITLSRSPGPAVGYGDKTLTAEFAAPWVDAGLLTDGQVYAAVGFTAAEAMAGIAAGTLGRGHAKAMAALRGVELART